jgi:uncharacterized membrane protein
VKQHVTINLLVLAVVSGGLLAAGWAPAPFGYLAALVVLLTGPGFGHVSALFLPGHLTLAERYVLSIVFSIAILVVTLFLLSASGMALSRTNISIAVVALTFLAGVVDLLVARGRTSDESTSTVAMRWELPLFGVALAFGTMLVIGVYILVR